MGKKTAEKGLLEERDCARGADREVAVEGHEYVLPR